MRTLVIDCLPKIGSQVSVSGWVNTRRDHGKIVFFDLRDRTGLLQVVLTPAVAEGLRVEDVVTITGTISRRPDKLINPKLPTGTIELQAEKVELLSKSAELPFDMGQEDLQLELPTLLDYRGLTLRHPKVKAIFEIQQVVIESFRQAMRRQNFLEFQSPSIISSVPEGGAEVFKVDYFGHPAYLSQSPQLYKSLLVSAYERVFSVNKVFRAEPSVTTRHLTEVVSLDAEMGFVQNWQETMDMAEYAIKFILTEVKQHCQSQLDLYQADIPKVSDYIPRLKLREVQQIIYDRTGRDCRQEKDLSPEDEREICKYTAEKFSSDLVFVTHFITAQKPFYVAEDPSDPQYALSMDLLGRGVEWLSGGQRIHQYEKLINKAVQWGINPGDIELYLQGFRYGCPPLGGFAFGAERITMHILNLKNIREASMFPRDMERVDTRFSRQDHA